MGGGRARGGSKGGGGDLTDPATPPAFFFSVAAAAVDTAATPRRAPHPPPCAPPTAAVAGRPPWLPGRVGPPPRPPSLSRPFSLSRPVPPHGKRPLPPRRPRIPSPRFCAPHAVPALRAAATAPARHGPRGRRRDDAVGPAWQGRPPLEGGAVGGGGGGRTAPPQTRRARAVRLPAGARRQAERGRAGRAGLDGGVEPREQETGSGFPSKLMRGSGSKEREPPG